MQLRKWASLLFYQYLFIVIACIGFSTSQQYPGEGSKGVVVCRRHEQKTTGCGVADSSVDLPSASRRGGPVAPTTPYFRSFIGSSGSRAPTSLAILSRSGASKPRRFARGCAASATSTCLPRWLPSGCPGPSSCHHKFSSRCSISP